MATILDFLNEDCWRFILDLLPTEDIVRSEQVSCAWQNVIFRYLQAVGTSIEIEYPWYGHKPSFKHRILKMEEDDPEKFEELTRKWGPSVRKTDCVNEDCLQVLRRNCPNLEDITFYGLQDDALLTGSPKNFKMLKRVHFRGCESVRLQNYLKKSNTDCFAFCGLYSYILKAYFGNSCCVYKKQVTDKCVKHWLVNYNIEELAVWGAEEITGKFIATPHSTKLNSLCFKECEALDFRCLESAVKHLRQLKKLELIYVPREIFQNVHLLLDKLPDLEDLCLRWEKRMDLGDEWGEAVGRTRLRRLDVSFNPNVTDEWLEKACHGFGRLNELLLEGCLGVTGRNLGAVCGAAGPSLQGLSLSSNVKIWDHHVVDVVRSCPNLKWIDVSYCHAVSNKITQKVAEARLDRKKIRLMVECTYVEEDYDNKYPWVVLDFGD